MRLEPEDTNSTVDDRLRRKKNLACNYCKPHRGDNKTRTKRGVQKRKHKQHRRN